MSSTDVDLLERSTRYSGYTRHDACIAYFWSMLRHRFNDQQRSDFLTFVHGRSRLPTSTQEIEQVPFTVMRPANSRTAHLTQVQIDKQMPMAHTCGFALELPSYSSLDIMTDRLLYAIQHW